MYSGVKNMVFSEHFMYYIIFEGVVGCSDTHLKMKPYMFCSFNVVDLDGYWFWNSEVFGRSTQMQCHVWAFHNLLIWAIQ